MAGAVVIRRVGAHSGAGDAVFAEGHAGGAVLIGRVGDRDFAAGELPGKGGHPRHCSMAPIERPGMVFGNPDDGQTGWAGDPMQPGT